MIGRTNIRSIGSSSGKAVALINVITPSEEFYGQIVGCSYETEKGTKVLVEVFSDTGTCTLAVPELTTYTIICGDVSATVEVTAEGTVLEVELVFPKAVLNLTTSNLDGEIVTVSIGTSAYTGIFVDGACTITVYEFGVATITCSETTVTQEVENGGKYTVDVTEITSITFASGNGALQNGAVFLSDSATIVTYNTVTIHLGVADGYSSGTRYLRIPKIKSLAGKYLKFTFNSSIYKNVLTLLTDNTTHVTFGSSGAVSASVYLNPAYFENEFDTDYFKIGFKIMSAYPIQIKTIYIE